METPKSNPENPFELKANWANYYAAILRASNWPEAAEWLQATHGSTDISARVDETLKDTGIVTSMEQLHTD